MGNLRGHGLLVLACSAQFMVVLDVSVLNVALPSIQRALRIDPADLQWVVNAYALVFGGFLVLGGRLADVYGRRRMFLLGLVLFAGASMVGGVAGTPGVLIAARAVQGVGAAVLAPTTLTLLITTYQEGPQRTRALAIWTAMALGGGTAGNLIGGTLTQLVSWRSILLINVPIGAVAVVAALAVLAPDARARRPERLDFAGAAFETLGFAALTYGINRIQTHGLGNGGTLAAVLAGIAALALFGRIETRVARLPLVPPRLLGVPAVARGNVVMLMAGACLIPMWYFLTLTMQHVLHYGPLQTGLGFLPHTLLTILVGVHITPRLMRHADDRMLISVAAAVAAAGFLWQSRIAPGDDYLSGIFGPAVLISLGAGLLITPITATVTSGVAESDAGAASGLMNTTKQVGGALGLATLVTITGRHQEPVALAAAYGRAFVAIAIILAVVAALASILPAAGRVSDCRTSLCASGSCASRTWPPRP